MIYLVGMRERERERGRRHEKRTSYLFISIACAVIGLYVFSLLWGCGMSYKQIVGADGVDGYCVPESIYSAWTWENKTKQPVRIAVSHISKGVDHAQAKGWTGSAWIYLTSLNGVVRPWKRHFDAEPYRYVELDEWIQEQKQWRR